MGSKPSKGQVIQVLPLIEDEPLALPDRNEMVPKVLLKTEAESRGFQQPPRDLANINALKNQVAKYHGIYEVKLHNVERNACKISSAAFLPNGYLLLTDQSNKALKLLNRIFQYVTHLNLPGRPHDVCVYSSNAEGSDIYVTIPSERTVLEIYVEGIKLVKGNSFKTENWCYGITAYKEGLLITVGTKLKFIDVNSEHIKCINYKKIGESPFGSPCYLDVINDSYIIISDSLKHALCCIDEDGHEIFRYNGMLHPHGVVYVGKDTLCLAGKDSKTSDVLQQVTLSGEKTVSLLTWKTVGFTPLALSYRPSDSILVIGGHNDRIKTFKLLPRDFKRKGWTSVVSAEPDNENYDLCTDTDDDSFDTDTENLFH